MPGYFAKQLQVAYGFDDVRMQDAFAVDSHDSRLGNSPPLRSQESELEIWSSDSVSTMHPGKTQRLQSLLCLSTLNTGKAISSRLECGGSPESFAALRSGQFFNSEIGRVYYERSLLHQSPDLTFVV